MKKVVQRSILFCVVAALSVGIYFQSLAQNPPPSEPNREKIGEDTSQPNLVGKAHPFHYEKEKQIWLGTIDKIKAQPTFAADAIHTSVYIARLSSPEKQVAAREAAKRGRDYYVGALPYAMNIAALPIEEWEQGIKNLAQFRQWIIKGNGLGNLALADWSNRLIYASLMVRAANGNDIQRVKQLRPLWAFLWDDPQRVAQILKSEFNAPIKNLSDVKPIGKMEPNISPKQRFELFDPLGIRYQIVNASLIENKNYIKLMAIAKNDLIETPAKIQTPIYQWGDIDLQSATLLNDLASEKVRGDAQWNPFYLRNFLEILQGVSRNEGITDFESRTKLFEDKSRLITAVKKYAPEVIQKPSDEMFRKVQPTDFWRIWQEVSAQKELLLQENLQDYNEAGQLVVELILQ